MQRRLTLLAVAAALVSGCSSAADTRSPDAAHARRSERPSPDPYIASLRYANCMRAHGVPQPRPDKHGDFHLTLADERRMRSVPSRIRKAADDVCFHHLRGLNLSPLSKNAIARANKVVASLGQCFRRYGFQVGAPEVRNLGRGRASFGFKPLAGNARHTRQYWQRYTQVGHRCEQQVHFASRLSKIIADDRKDTVNGNL